MPKPAAGRGASVPRHAARERAKHLLVHRANGAIHNAVLALKLVGEGPPSPGAPAQNTASVVGVGLRGTVDAARALRLLGALVGLESASAPPDSDAYIDDITRILQAESRRRGITIEMTTSERAPSAPAIPIEALAEILVAGLSAVADALPNSALRIRAREKASPPDAPIRFEIDVEPTDAA